MPVRQRNPRGQGEKLRDEIVEAASRLLADPAGPPFTLRAVAREVGVAATSVYLHFADIPSLMLEVTTRRFGVLARLLAEAEAVASARTPRDRVLAASRAYCEFGLANPGHYQVMFNRPLPDPAPGYAVFQQLINVVAEFLWREPDDQETLRTATIVWQWLHGTVSLRISRPGFSWPPLAEAVTEAVDRILAGVSSGRQRA